MARDTGAVSHSPVVRVSADAVRVNDETVVTTARKATDDIPVRRTGPSGIARDELLVLATLGGRTAFFLDPSPSDVQAVIGVLADGDLPTKDADAVTTHEQQTMTLPVPETGPLSVGYRLILGPCGWVDPLNPAEHTFTATSSTAELAADVGLLGRGRGDMATNNPVGNMWATARTTDSDPVIVVNANEARDGQQVDRTLLAATPMTVLDGVAAVAEYIGAEDAIIYLNETDTHLSQHVQNAIDAAADVLPVVPKLTAGPDEYYTGEPTAALEALEGADRIEPRLQPPTPAEHGLYGRSTVIHTPRTFAHIHRILADPDMYDSDATDPGTRLFTVTGDVTAPVIIELPSESTIATVRNAIDMEGTYKMACVGGILGGFIRDLDITPTAQSLRAADLGTDGVVELLNADRCALATAGERARFAATENSGRCVPGREGTKQLTELLRDVYDGSFESDKIRELGRVMRQSSNCQIGAHAPRPVTTAIDEFEPEFRAHTNGRCPAGTCTEKL
ncbi:NADH-ubiquinone oxidoreductase-F iron-sulfur binding region domain-containing protein [Haloarcula sp. 1CSR25-25]|uniref:NADH-ubiquinone oxidoreductase-F iron-sulfur binding region domain-containing protein n=1 Tax=Haloarcula sp. 1CSR25-25 TaxID=2862545 RepID=UPI0028955B98|nr:NADH-ubiquinone oxidoreductase-F iron-sulfur binding region domain-containing protein [Haloarcula sp. 1CSR25-25]MDT3437762.1 NADH dehydrogenase FAD-containing subunit [Haloarcula sp. 1CSR25-25]